MTNTIKWDKPCYKCLSHLCNLSCKETSKTEEQDDEVLGFNGWGFPIEKPNKVMTTQTEVLKMALEALETIDGWLLARYPCGLMPKEQEAITAIKEVLAQPEQEPLDNYCKECLTYNGHHEGCSHYTTPPQHNPLTDEQIKEASLKAGMQEHYMGFHSGFIRFARAIESAHGIKENT